MHFFVILVVIQLVLEAHKTTALPVSVIISTIQTQRRLISYAHAGVAPTSQANTQLTPASKQSIIDIDDRMTELIDAIGTYSPNWVFHFFHSLEALFSCYDNSTISW